MKEKLIEIPKAEVQDSIEDELTALDNICKSLNELQEDSQARIFQYLKSRFRNAWPYESN